MRIASIIAAALAASVSGYALADAAAVDGPPSGTGEDALQTIVVTGSRIPRIEAEGPSPVVTITAADILNNGFANTADIMSSLTQNLGALDNNQYTDGFSPGAQAVDLRGLGPNHTLVLVNGRRIADYPQAYGGNSNFTDISNIPTSMLDRIEILSGSDSAIYGSDAVSGVINFIMKKKADGTTVDFRAGDTEHGGGSSQRLTITSGYSNDRFDSIFSVELLNQQPLWAYQRNFTDSRQDSPADPSDIHPSTVFLRTDFEGSYLDPGQATCNSLSHLDNGTVFRAARDGYGPGPDYGTGYWCGSYSDVGYGTLENGRQAINFYGSASYRLSDQTSLFLDVQAADSEQVSYDTPLQWQNSFAQDGTSVPVPFYNQATGQVEQWQRRYFTIEENGGFDAGKIHNDNVTFSINAGVKGAFNANWSYEALLGYSQNKLKEKWPVLISAKAQELYLGPSLGTDPGSGYQIYNAPVSRLYTPLTVDQFRSITTDSIDEDTSSTQNLSFTLNNGRLWEMPAGPVGFAAVAEYGHDSLKQEVDPGSLDGSYYQYHNTAADGSRNRFGAGIEFRIPLLSSVILNAATRYDEYRYSGNASGKVTYNGGLEWRPLRSLLVRGSIGTGFRAPDLSYLYAGESGSSSGGIDYWQCAAVLHQDPDSCDLNDVGFNGRSHGSTTLKDETSVSYTYGFVFSPTKNLSVNADYYNIALSNEVLYQSSDTILREEADCKLGVLDPNSPFCQQVISQVTRFPHSDLSNPDGIIAVEVLPINAASDRTSGVDMGAHWLIEAGRAGNFELSGGYTHVIKHTIQLAADQPVDDQLTDLYTYVIPKDKATYSAGWTLGKFTTTIHGNWLGGLPNYDGTKRLSPTQVYNASMVYRFTDRGTFTFFVDNLFDEKPQRDPTWTSYPYYSRNWFSPVGRAFFLEASYRFGGSPAK
jgi:iron complex outermembrane recepter protein